MSDTEILTRLGWALFAGFLIGIERESRGRAAGLRTTMLTCITAALTMICAQKVFTHTSDGASRVIQGVLTGIGFIGSGTILRQENAIRGVTTAASLWIATVLGLLFGLGLVHTGMVGLAVSLIILVGFSLMEQYILNDEFAHVTIVLSLEGPTLDELRHSVEKSGINVVRAELEVNLAAGRRTVVFSVHARKQKKQTLVTLSQRTIDSICCIPGIISVKWA